MHDDEVAQRPAESSRIHLVNWISTNLRMTCRHHFQVTGITPEAVEYRCAICHGTAQYLRLGAVGRIDAGCPAEEEA